MSGSRSPRRRNRWATRQLNPELSIVTTTSGRSRCTAATVSRTRRRISGARGNTSATPATARSASGTRLVRPSARIRSPPMPSTRKRPPVRSRKAAISAAPIASPEGSPAIMKMNGAASSAVVMARERRPRKDRPRRPRGSPRLGRGRWWPPPLPRSLAARSRPPGARFAARSSADRPAAPARVFPI